MGKAGRKGKYEEWLTEEGLFKIEGWAKRGLTELQIAKDCIGVSMSTLSEWKVKFPEIAEALKTGKVIPDMQVEGALFKNAMGYDVEETKVVVDKAGQPIRIEKTKKHIRPDTTAQIFYLQNRMPDVWRNVQRIEHSGQVDTNGNEEAEAKLAETEEGRELLKRMFELKYQK